MHKGDLNWKKNSDIPNEYSIRNQQKKQRKGNVYPIERWTKNVSNFFFLTLFIKK